MKIQFKRNNASTSILPTIVAAGEPVWFKDQLWIGSVGTDNGGTDTEGKPIQVAMMSDVIAASNNQTVKADSVTFGSNDVVNILGSGEITATGNATNKTITIANTVTHPSTSAGTYNSVTVDAHGHVTAGTNPTTLAGYGITDAKIEGDTITLGSTAITPLTSHQSIKTLASSTTAQTVPTAAVDIKGSGSITLHKVAWTGTYSDLIGTPTIPTVNDATLTVAGDGTYLSVGTNNAGDTFTANASSSKTITVNHKTRTETLSNSTGTVGSGNTGTTGTFDVVTYTFDAAGHETAKDTKTITVTFPSAADLGVTGAMHFVGLSTTDPASAGASVSGHTTWAKGDVVLYGNKEYVLNGTTNVAANWVELGDESSYALKTVKVEGSGVLGGGGDLSTNRTITHNTSGVTAGSYGDSGSTRTATYGGTINIPYITVNDTGHITSASTKTITLPASDNTIGKQVVAASNSGTSNASTTTNTTTYLNHVESGSVQSAIQIKGDGIVGVTAANGVITISASDTNQDTKVTQTLLTNDDAGVYPILASRYNVSDWASQTTLTDESKLNKEITIDNSGYVTAVGFKTHTGSGFLMADGSVNNTSYLTTEHNQTIKAKNNGSGSALTFGADDAIEFIQGTKITLATDTTNKTITINHAAGESAGASKTSIGGVNNNTLTIPVVSTDAQGHVTGLTTATYTATPNTDEKVIANEASVGSYKLLLAPNTEGTAARPLYDAELEYDVANNHLFVSGQQVATTGEIPAAAKDGNFNVVGATSSSSAIANTVKYGSADQNSATTLTFSTTATGGWFTVGGSAGAATVTLDAIDGGTF